MSLFCFFVLMGNHKITIAIDGYSACGKSTLARELATRLDYTFIDSGAMYRGVTLFALRNNIIQGEAIDQKKLIELLPSISISFKKVGDTFRHLHLNNEDVEQEIRNKPVSDHVSPIAEIKEVRKFLVDQQQKMGRLGGIVMDGRDIGTVVFPNAELKIFVTANIEVRVQRRLDELKSKGIDSNANEVRDNLTQRDYIDSTRAESPLRKADDAVEIDNSDLTREQQLNLALELAQERLNSLIKS